MENRSATKIGKWFPIPESDRWINGDPCYKRYLIYDQHDRPLGHYSECLHVEYGGYLWDSRYSGFMHLPSIDNVIYWLNRVNS